MSATQPAKKRRRSLVDKPVQGALLLQTIVHWILITGAATVILFIWQILLGQPEATLAEHFAAMWQRYAPFFVVIMVLVPVVIRDSLRLSNRIAGPIYKLRREMARWAEGDTVQPLSFRKGDFWPDLAESFNTVLAKTQRSDSTAIDDGGDSLRGPAASVSEESTSA